MSEHILDSLTCGILTREQLDAESYGFRTEWIQWDSGFRTSGLQVGDLLIACDGVRYTRENQKQWQSNAVGSYGEAQMWRKVRAKDGQAVVLTVQRDGEVFDVAGRLLAARYWRDDKGRKTLGSGGPGQLERDGFSSAWGVWLEQNIETWSQVLGMAGGAGRCETAVECSPSIFPTSPAWTS